MWLNDKLDSREQHPKGCTTQDLVNKVLDQIASSPFTKDIKSRQPSRKFTPQKFTSYVAKSDLIGHVRHYKQMMALWNGDQSLMCRVFPSSLGEIALRWFDKLLASSVFSWRQLAELFTSCFIANSKQPREVDYLLTLQKNEGEGLREYARRY